MSRPTDIKYAKTHEWVRIEKDIATTGISDFAVAALSDLVYVDMPQVTDLLEQGQPYAEVESVKAVSDIYAPLSGEIVEVNEELGDNLELLAKDPFGKGWIVKFRISHPNEVEGLMDAAAYDRHCKDEAAKH
ncbi:MAG: Glycine cleavage system H protein [Planctomycetes bacterium]|nr:Glycine cleavage system H protein [Planctomycetota bacterium]